MIDPSFFLVRTSLCDPRISVTRGPSVPSHLSHHSGVLFYSPSLFSPLVRAVPARLFFFFFLATFCSWRITPFMAVPCQSVFLLAEYHAGSQLPPPLVPLSPDLGRSLSATVVNVATSQT